MILPAVSVALKGGLAVVKRCETMMQCSICLKWKTNAQFDGFRADNCYQCEAKLKKKKEGSR